MTDNVGSPTIRDLYPEFSDDQQKSAEEHLVRYIEAVLRIYDRVHSGSASDAGAAALTDANRSRYDLTNEPSHQ